MGAMTQQLLCRLVGGRNPAKKLLTSPPKVPFKEGAARVKKKYDNNGELYMLAASNLSTFDNKVELHQNNSPFMLLVLPLKTASSSTFGALLPTFF